MAELVEPGRLAELDELSRKVPRGELVRAPGGGPRIAELLGRRLGTLPARELLARFEHHHGRRRAV